MTALMEDLVVETAKNSHALLAGLQQDVWFLEDYTPEGCCALFPENLYQENKDTFAITIKMLADGCMMMMDADEFAQQGPSLTVTPSQFEDVMECEIGKRAALRVTGAVQEGFKEVTGEDPLSATWEPVKMQGAVLSQN